jgi:uncharacterized protein
MSGYRILALPAIAVGLGAMLMAQKAVDDLKLTDWRPKSQLVVKETRILRPRYPVIDMHNHLGRLENTQKYLDEMEQAGVWKCVSLDGNSAGDRWKEHLKVSSSVSEDRFLVFFRPDFSKIDEPGFGEREAQRLEQAVRAGARGLKIAKNLGLTTRDKTGNVVPVDDPRIDPIWAKCGELGIPVMIHVSDPAAFFTPLDRFNERYDELIGHPSWLFNDPKYPRKNAILAQRNRVIARHPKTIFIGAHVGNLPEDLNTVGTWLDTYPNFHVDIDARISELGRQPYSARKWFLQYQDRIMFGTDTAPNAEAYRIYYRFLETDDEYFDPSGGHHLQGRWMIYGVHLPDEVLKKVYYQNALKILNMQK